MAFVAGSIAGCAGQLVGHPLDTIKTRLQSEGLTTPTTSTTTIQKGGAATTTSTSAYRCAVTIYNEGGFRGFFRGLSLPLCSKSLEQCIAFGIKSTVDRILLHNGNNNNGSSNNSSMIRTGLSGAIAGATTAVILTPVYLVKVQLQVTPKHAVGAGGGAGSGSAITLNGPIAAIRKTIHQLGFLGLYTGATPIFLGTSIGYAFRFLTYEQTTTLMEESFGFGRIGATIIGGGMAGMATWASHYPLDLVASRMEASVALGKPQLTMRKHFYDIYAQSGFKGYFRGLGPCLLRAFPVNATIFMTYDLVVRKTNLVG